MRSTVELYVGDGASKPEKRGQQVVARLGREPTPVEFSLSGLALGTHQGFVRIVGSDALPSRRCAVLHGRRAAAEQGAAAWRKRRRHAVFARGAVADVRRPARRNPKFACEVRQFSELSKLKLADYAAVCLVDPPPLPAAAWQALVDFAEARRRRGNVLGPQCRAAKK